MKNKKYYTVMELAKMLGISRVAVFKKIKKGEIKAEKIGRNFVIDSTGRKEAGAKGEIAIYKSPSGPEIQVKLEKETVWLDARAIAALFGVDRTGIVRHIASVYKTGELGRNSTCAKIAQVAKDGKIREMDFLVGKEKKTKWWRW